MDAENNIIDCHIDGEDFKIMLSRRNPEVFSLGMLVSEIVRGEVLVAQRNIKNCLRDENPTPDTNMVADSIKQYLMRCYRELERRERWYCEH